MQELIQPGRWLLRFAFVCSLFGCRGPRESDYIPSEDTARTALQRALDAWKSGQKPGQIQEGSPKIQLVDEAWQAGDKLTTFEILRAQDKPGGQRWFSVKLTLASSEQPQEVSYVVTGIDPLWVYREDEYKKYMGMGD